MTLTGHAYALGAGTIINAIATWKGVAFGIDLKTFADVELSKNERIASVFRDYAPLFDLDLIIPDNLKFYLYMADCHQFSGY